VVTSNYSEVHAALSRLQTEGGRLHPGVRQELIAAGQALVDLEESYKPGTRPLQQETIRANDTSNSLNDEGRRLEARADALRGDPNRTQGQIDAFYSDLNDYYNRQSAHNSYVADLNSRIDADNRSLESYYAAYVQRVSAAFAAAPTTAPPS